MDERIRDSFLKIRSELLAIVMGICGVSLIVKFMFLGADLSDCITEYLVLVGSPVYLVIRSHMLGVTQPADLSGKNRLLVVMLTGFVFLMVFILVREKQGAQTEGITAFMSVGSFVISFVGVRYLYQRHERKRQEKLDQRYDEK
ncbi:MAG: hypothetical protein HFG62_05565 [Lachnospiraceae bacterium]|jgi:hypothetical protein|nr:hypothetical protein [Lachnospiraceae bacterium]